MQGDRRLFSKSSLRLEVPSADYADATEALLESWSEKAEQIEDVMLLAAEAKIDELGLDWKVSFEQ